VTGGTGPGRIKRGFTRLLHRENFRKRLSLNFGLKVGSTLQCRTRLKSQQPENEKNRGGATVEVRREVESREKSRGAEKEKALGHGREWTIGSTPEERKI